MGNWLIVKLVGRLRQLFFTTYFRKKIKNCGKGFVVKGPIRLVNEGRITIGDNVILDSTPDAKIKIKIGKSGYLIIGSNVYLNEGVEIICNSKVEIEDFTLIAPEVLINDDDYHPIDPELRKVYKNSSDTKSPIRIGENVWLCSRVIVLKGVVIGKNSVVAAGAVVSRSIPEGVLAAGIPAKSVRKF